MPEVMNLEDFKPETAEQLLEGILGQVFEIAGNYWEDVQGVLSENFESIARASFATLKRLQSGKIDQQRADMLLHTQELALNSALLYIEFLTYELAQKILNGVMKVIVAAIKNITGINLNFG